MLNKKNYSIILFIVFSIGLFTGIGQVKSIINTTKLFPIEPITKASASIDGKNNTNFNPDDTIQEVLYAINSNSVENIDTDLTNKMSVNLVKGILRELGDQNTRYADKDEMRIISNAQKGIFEGIGIKTNIKKVNKQGISEEILVVGSVIPQTPASKSGLMAGDIIISIDGKEILPYDPYGRIENRIEAYRKKPDETKQKIIQKFVDNENKRIENGIPILEAEKKLSVNGDQVLKLSINRNNKNITVSVATTTTTLPATTTKIMFNDKLYISINAITNELPGEIQKIIYDTNKNKKITGVILDLRDVFGGTYKNASETMKYFIPGASLGKLITEKNKPFDLKIPAYNKPLNKKLVVLVNNGTAKYGEMMAYALSQNKKASIIGNNTAGDLSDISLFSLNNGGGYTIKSGNYKLPHNITFVIPSIKETFSADRLALNKSTIQKSMK